MSEDLNAPVNGVVDAIPQNQIPTPTVLEQQPSVQQPVEVEAQAQAKPQEKKQMRRGVASARGTSRMRFSHELAKPNGLFLAHLDSVRCDMVKISEEGVAKPSFNGLEIPRLTLTFASNEQDPLKRHYIDLALSTPESNVKTIPGGAEEWKVSSILDWLKHILNVFVLKGREFTDEEIAMLSIGYDDFDQYGEYSPVESEVVVACWKSMFDNVIKLLETGRNGKAAYKDDKGGFVSVWIKLLRYTKSNNKGWMALNNGELAFNTFVGEGAIEIYKPNMGSTLRLNTVREAIIPMNVEKPKSPNMPIMGNMPQIMPQGVPMGGNPIMAQQGQGDTFNEIATNAADDLPF